MSDRNGFSLLDALFTVAIAAILAGFGAPAFSNLVLDNRRTSEINTFVAAVQLARSESAMRGRYVTLCASRGGLDCESADRWSDGYLVFINVDRDRPPRVDPGEQIVFSHKPQRLTLRSNRAAYVVRPARRSTNGTVVFCDRRGDASARAVIISYTSRPRVASHTAGRKPLSCAE